MNFIRVEVVIHSDIKRVWEMFTNPKHIMKWNHATDDWECTYAKNELKSDGHFVFRMTAKDKSASFNLMGTYKEIHPQKSISYVMNDKRKVTVAFEKILEYETRVIELFQPERINSESDQQFGWQTILNNFKKYAEENTNIQLADGEEVWMG